MKCANASCLSTEKLKEQPFKSLLQLLFIGPADAGVDDLAVGVDIERNRVGRQFKAVGYLAGIQSGGEGYLVFLNELQDILGCVLSEYPKEMDSALIFIVRALQTWSFFVASTSPGGPKVQKYGLAA